MPTPPQGDAVAVVDLEVAAAEAAADVISPLELARAADLYEASKNQVKLLMKLTVGLMVMLLLSLLCICVLVFCVVDLTKETKADSHQVRPLQRDMVTEPGFSVPMRVAGEHSQKEEEMCPDGTFKAPGLDCAPSCEDNLPVYCPTERAILWLSQTTNINYTDDPEAMKCACPVACPEGTEFCRPQHAGLVCDRFILPFMKSDSCRPVCSGWRDSATGRCMTPCGDPSGTSAFEGEKDTTCPKPCPDANATEQGKPESAMWVSPSQEYPADQVIEKLCPKICSTGEQVWGPDFTCPIECLDDSGKKIKETGSNETLKAWPSKGQTAAEATKMYCPDSTVV
mmetsp:Transcript_54422/g.98158  ORF Transcript_54422/g.98158 Transcript_54422/m.98158 type:complete len:340 (-) Transcript_54422:146-1165(-)